VRSIAIAGNRVTTCAIAQTNSEPDCILPRMVDPERPPDTPQPPASPATEREPPPPQPPASPAIEREPPPPQPPASPAIEPGPPPLPPPIPPPVEPPPLFEPPPTQPPTPSRAYVLPSPRKVVSSGLALALASTSDLRRASIYIGLLMLGAFGPAIVAFLLILGRLGESGGDVLGALFFGSGFAGPPVPPALEAALLVVLFEALFGLLLFVSISIDAQVIAIAILGGRAAERPLRLWESIIRARQTFWRMAGSGTLVGIVTVIVQGLIVAAIDGFSRSPEASGVAGALLATIIVAPLAYVSTSVVLGDVGAMEAISRSWRLFKARRLLAVVVVLFTFVTSAIHLFALSAGVDLVVRAADLLQVSVTEGALAFLAAAVLILAVVVAYGSLTFTISAIVSAPQVTGFLGLTFYSAGLDRALVDAPKPPRGFHYVTRPMLVALVVLSGLVAVQIPAINAIDPPPTSASMELVRNGAATQSDLIEVYGAPHVVVDPAGDAGGGQRPNLDLVQGEAAYLEDVPSWLLAEFDCARPNVACGAGSQAEGIPDAAYLFLHRAAGPVASDAPSRAAVLVSLEAEVRVPGADGTSPFGWASRVVVTTFGAAPALTALRTSGTELRPLSTAARSAWNGTDVVTLVPAGELPASVTGWDLVMLEGIRPGTAGSSRDGLRASWSDELLFWDGFAAIFIDDFRGEPGS
jgi:hypothetical protein